MYIRGAMEIGLGATVKLFHLYLEDGLAPSLDLLHMRISPWYQFSRPFRPYPAPHLRDPGHVKERRPKTTKQKRPFPSHVRSLPIPEVPTVENAADRRQGAPDQRSVHKQDLQLERGNSEQARRSTLHYRPRRRHRRTRHQRSARSTPPRFGRYTRPRRLRGMPRKQRC